MSEDLELWLRFLSKKVKMGYSKKILIDYRLPKTSLFRNKKIGHIILKQDINTYSKYIIQL